MSKRIKWSHELRVKLYRAVLSVMGLPNDYPRDARGKPEGLSQKDYVHTLDSISVSLGLGKSKGKALSNQIAWLTCIPSSNCHEGHWNNRIKNIKAAEEAGYFMRSNSTTTIGSIDTSDISPWGFEDESKPNVFVRIWSRIKNWFG
jgi:hypothetical protein